MMYGYGDAPTPYKETVDLVEVRGRLCTSHSLLLGRGAGAPLHLAQPPARP